MRFNEVQWWENHDLMIIPSFSNGKSLNLMKNHWKMMGCYGNMMGIWWEYDSPRFLIYGILWDNVGYDGILWDNFWKWWEHAWKKHTKSKSEEFVDALFVRNWNGKTKNKLVPGQNLKGLWILWWITRLLTGKLSLCFKTQAVSPEKAVACV